MKNIQVFLFMAVGVLALIAGVLSEDYTVTLLGVIIVNLPGLLQND